MTAAALSDGIVERVQGRAAALERIGASEDAADLRAILSALTPEAPAREEVVMAASDAPMWADGIVTDGENVAMAQKAETDHGGHYWAVDGGNGGLDWQPTHFISLDALKAPAEKAEYLDAIGALSERTPEAPADGAVEASTVPPPHWTDEDQYDRHPKSADEWNWRNDPPLQDGGLALAVRRLNFAADRADPRAPDQMTLVLRKDLINVKHELIRQTAIAAAREMRL